MNDTYNYYHDKRVCSRAKDPILYTDDGDEISLPTRYEVCPVCDGNGTHVNPAIDCNGLSNDDFDEDPDFRDDYFSGVYDITCNYCGGKRVYKVVDEGACTEAQYAAWERQCQSDAEDEAVHRAELAMGC